MYVQNAITIAGRKQIQILAGTRSPPLEAGLYDVWADADAYIDTEPAGVTAPTSTTGYLIPGGVGIVSVRIPQDGLTIGSSAALSAFRVE